MVMARKKTPQAHSIVADEAFQPMGEARTDSKKRLVLKGKVAKHYFMYQNDAGQILLEPMAMIPASEAWLYKNPEAMASVRRGLDQAAKGKGRCLGSFAKHAEGGPED